MNPAPSAPASALSDGPGLHEELAAIDQDFPGWHCWSDTAGWIWATHVYGRAEMAAITQGLQVRYVGSGVTLDAPTPDLIRYGIAVWKHEWDSALFRAGVAA
jgi:hypothetical protein